MKYGLAVVNVTNQVVLGQGLMEDVVRGVRSLRHPPVYMPTRYSLYSNIICNNQH